MPRWWKIPSWRRLTKRFRCWMRLRAARNAWNAAVEEHRVEEPAAPPKDPFNEIDFGSYFQDYLDPGYRTQPEYEENEKPSFENFLSQPTTLADHLAWQLGALTPGPRSCMRRRSSSSAIWTKTAIWPAAKRSWRRHSAIPGDAGTANRPMEMTGGTGSGA